MVFSLLIYVSVLLCLIASVNGDMIFIWSLLCIFLFPYLLYYDVDVRLNICLCIIIKDIRFTYLILQELLLLEDDVKALEEMYPQGEKVINRSL